MNPYLSASRIPFIGLIRSGENSRKEERVLHFLSKEKARLLLCSEMTSSPKVISFEWHSPPPSHSLRYNYIPISASIQGLNVLPNCFFVQSRARRESHPAGLARVPRVALPIATLTRGDSLPPLIGGGRRERHLRNNCTLHSRKGRRSRHALSLWKQSPIRGVDEFRWRKGSEQVRAGCSL